METFSADNYELRQRASRMIDIFRPDHDGLGSDRPDIMNSMIKFWKKTGKVGTKFYSEQLDAYNAALDIHVKKDRCITVKELLYEYDLLGTIDGVEFPNRNDAKKRAIEQCNEALELFMVNDPLPHIRKNSKDRILKWDGRNE